MSDKYGADTTAEEVAYDFASEIKGRSFLVTGVTWGGMGAETARVLAKHSAKLVVLAGRSSSKIEEAISKIHEETPEANLTALILDLASLKSVRAAAAEVNSYKENIDVLINNAGVMACPYTKTEDGFEMQFGANHLGHFLFTGLIFAKIINGKKPRIINISSYGHRLAPVLLHDPNFTGVQKYDPWFGYGQSKTANILFSRELNKRYGSKGLVSFSVHPGTITNTNLARHIDLTKSMAKAPTDYYGKPLYDEEAAKKRHLKNVSSGASTAVVAALDPSKAAKSGAYLADCQIAEDQCVPHAKDMEAASKLWELSEKLVDFKFPN